ncbi:hypothetical protein K431DRAFT_103628 [Polychaeton citri CBS 116435]|uniref:DNA helicase n=1 Tax=Polychaeton citri CBS 116435 TaxID=1314669 RepID=A0A9P4Q5G6_9PEZI|nr:hypothetical protein K431DRAFT_103628 [Polychaeton citri CBS 116435]
MVDSDPISESTPLKRRKLTHDGKAWDSGNDSGDDLFSEDYQQTVPTQSISAGLKRRALPPTQLNGSSLAYGSSYPRASSPFTTQPTQVLAPVTQPTQLLPTTSDSAQSSDVQVTRSSPPAPSSPPSQHPEPITRAPFSKPRSSLLGSAMAPPGTTFRRPQDARPRPVTTVLDEDSDEDPPIRADSSEEETQGASGNIRPTNFTKGGRGLDSSPNRIVESPKQAAVGGAGASGGGAFSSLMSSFGYTGSPQPPKNKPVDDLVSAYGNVTRRPRPPVQQTSPQRAQPVNAEDDYKTLDDVQDYIVRQKVARMMAVLPGQSVQKCVDALRERRGREDDAMDLLVSRSEPEVEKDELSLSVTKGVAKPVALAHGDRLSQPEFKRPSAKQQVKAPKMSIAEKYASSQAARRPSQPQSQFQSQSQPVQVVDLDEEEEEDGAVRAVPKRRLQQGRRPARSPSPPSPVVQRAGKKPIITIDDDDDDDDEEAGDSGLVSEGEEAVATETTFDGRLLKFFNECSTSDLADLCAQPADVVQLVIDQRPFSSLDDIRAITKATDTKTKSGKKSRARPIGDKIVDDCTEMMTGYEAVDDLVDKCEDIAKPIQDTLKSWGVGGAGDGELQLMNLDEAGHDSGIGTPASSCLSDDNEPSKKRAKHQFLRQPPNMSKDLEMKDYQLVGLNWLNLLWSKKLSCILADDMGLGKTCQVISFFAHLAMTNVDGVGLVVVPGSTIENWLREFGNFAPELKVVAYYGSQAERPALQAMINEEFDTINVIVTTYDMAVKPDDNRFLRKEVDPLICVYDEAHALRNPKSQRYSQLMRIPADFKILLTGTPLQNNLQELVAILAFIMPDLFRQKGDDLEYIFKHKATTKDADHAALLSAERITRARTMMTPFILRRKKQQVLWLPTKHSRVEFCDMTESQAAFYDDSRAEFAELLSSTHQLGSKASAKQSSNILMALRKAAIHPLLSRRLYTDKVLKKIQTALLKHEEFSGNPPDKVWAYLTGEHHQAIGGGDFGLHRFCEERSYLHKFMLKHEEWMDSGKVQKFAELVKNYATNGDRALVFSQFTSLMDILEAVLETLNIKFMRLDGSTRMDTRQDMIDQFMTDDSITIFMLSTKAGGAGINLACANKVIIFDSGFNPQDDIQAENRAHRVGQTREVEVVRLVSKDTIEEQIHALGESKLALDERVAGEGLADKDAEKEGEKMVQKMFATTLKQPDVDAGKK